ncbi:DUF4395 domain-containing protein [Spirosoma soli]|uniref:DUF4395 domain-containing protein n=1 Tax=Spirosoma soli TaxID=1770529 RepID=A0ABW5M7H8_9BACT
MARESIVCPTDGVQVNESKVRTVAFLVLLTTLAYLLTNVVWLIALLTVDFGLRAFNTGQYSPFGTVAGWLVKQFHLPFKGTDQAPKRFAARIGFVFGASILVAHGLGWNTSILSSVLAIFAGLESLLGFCAGCYVYTYYHRWFSPNTTSF